MNNNRSLKFVLYVVSLTLWPATSAAETTTSCVPMGLPESIELAFSDASSSDCGTYLDEAGKDATFCQWTFAYRSPPAKEAFLAAEYALDGCFEKTGVLGTNVNHPDSYDQVLYSAGSQAISLSLKDKAGHQATYLFLRVETAP
ncbi:MAG: hypothetical protein AAFO72_08755 [Pseudomonadota bacterium]